MRLKEVFTKPKGKIKWVERSPKHYAAEYGVGQDRIFEFIALRGHTTEDMIFPVEGIPLEKVWLIGFAQKKPEYSHRITGKGDAIEVMNKTLVAFKEFAKMAKPEYITFSAKEPSRMKLYNIMVKKLMKGLGFEVLTTDSGNYVLKRKGAK